MHEQVIRVAVIDMYNNEPNEGMRGILHLLRTHQLSSNQRLEWKRYDVRHAHEIPTLDYDIYISSGGPGSPLHDPHAKWEAPYFSLIDSIINYNENHNDKKYLFLICHSFQLMCLHLNVALVTKRKSQAFGIFPIHKIEQGNHDPVFSKLHDPFYAVDSRFYQVIQPHHKILDAMGAKVLAIEKERPHVPYERAVMAIRFTPEILGCQFHPEADSEGMKKYLTQTDKKEHVIETHGLDKYQEMLDSLNDPDKILFTQEHIIPVFINQAIEKMMVHA